MIEYLPIIINIAIVVITLFWIQYDMEGRGIEGKFYWVWSIVLMGGWLLLGLIGVVMVLVGYYIWSREMRE